MATSNIAAESHTQNDGEMATSNIAAESHTQNDGEMTTSNMAAESHTQNDEEMATSNNPSYQKSYEKKDLLRLSSTDTGVKHKQSLVFCSRFYPSAPTLFTGTQHLTLPPRVTPRTMEKWQHLTLPPRVTPRTMEKWQHLTLPPRVTPRTMEKWQHLTLPPRVTPRTMKKWQHLTTRAISNPTRKKTCFVCHQHILGSNISSHLSSAHGFTRQLARYLLARNI